MSKRKLFGTDGIRGVANAYPMTPEMILRLGKAIAHVLSYKNGKHRIIIGKDTRLSGYMFETALTTGMVSMGVDVLLVGPMPTPAIAHLTKSLNCDVGIVLSASHNPAQDNGIKIFDKDGFKLPDAVEAVIEKLALSKEIESDNFRGESIGKAYRVDDAKGRYIEFAKSSIKSVSLKGIKIVLDCANGAAYHIAPDIFSELGADVIILNNKPDGNNINLNCGALHPELIQAKVKEVNADIGIALDGDADRVIVCDEKGALVDGDRIIVMLALDLMEKNLLNKNTAVVTDYSNLGLDKAIKAAGGKVIRTENGDRYVMEAMRKKGYNLGGEKSGHIIFGRHSTTGDGVITALQILLLIKNSNKKLSQLAKCMKEMPQVLINVDVKEKKKFEDMPSVNSKIKEIEKNLKGKGRLLLRYSGTQNICRIMIEGQDKEEIEEYAKKIANEIKKEIG